MQVLRETKRNSRIYNLLVLSQPYEIADEREFKLVGFGI